MGKRQRLVSQSDLCAYVKATLGRINAEGESLLALAAQCLVSQGAQRPDQISDRRFIELHAHMVRRRQTKRPAQKPQLAVVVSEVDPRSPDFLSSYAWRQVRMVVLKRDGARCACCGASPSTGAVMHVDHIKPRKTHPQLALDPANLQVLCEACNHGKGNWDATDWRRAAEGGS